MSIPLIHSSHIKAEILDVMIRGQKLIQILDSRAELLAQHALVFLLLPLLHQVQDVDRGTITLQQLIQVFT